MFPYLTREQIQGVLDYYAQYPDRVDEDFRRNAITLAELQNRQLSYRAASGAGRMPSSLSTS